MPELLNASKRTNSNLSDHTSEGDALRTLSRSPHPYHRIRSELLHPSETLSTAATSRSSLYSEKYTGDAEPDYDAGIYTRGASPRTTSDSGTEADDEHFLKGLPAPKLRPHKGLRSSGEIPSGDASPLPSPKVLDEEETKLVVTGRSTGVAHAKQLSGDDSLQIAEKFRQKRRAEIRRRITEVLLLGVVGAVVVSSDSVGLVLNTWRRELSWQLGIFASLTILYPLRLLKYSKLSNTHQPTSNFFIPAEFDPAPLLYPPWLTMFVAAVLSPANPAAILPNILLSIASLPSELIPTVSGLDSCNALHWLITCVPLFVTKHKFKPLKDTFILHNYSNSSIEYLRPEILVLLYPLHQALCITLHYLTTTSLLRAELQLLSISLINVLLLSSSPQAIILKALLWGGGVGMFISCGQVLKWVVTLARVPKWRFRRASNLSRYSGSSIRKSRTYFSWLLGVKIFIGSRTHDETSESENENFTPLHAPRRRQTDLKAEAEDTNGPARSSEAYRFTSAIEATDGGVLIIDTPEASAFGNASNVSRRHTLPNISSSIIRSNKRTPSGRRKRSASSSLQSFFSLTERQAAARKYIYASCVYLSVLAIIFVGIRSYVGKYALGGSEPIGWALGYLLGNIADFRMAVVTTKLERWVCLPGWNILNKDDSYQLGWMEHLRHSTFGEANTRLILCIYWLAVTVVGLAVVFRLSAIYEVDTRRKVFHFMMVAMLLPATYVDPPFAALALTLVLAIFLLLDLFRASQLPPLSKPLASFLTPYVDGRDLRGPVVISHIFLLIGCAIPLWLSLGTLSRTGLGCWVGWDVPTRDVSMVAGVICVGMGDAAASLIGRRYGRHKWFWSGGKSLEGSLAFATAVGTALCVAKGWLRLGGWTSSNDPWILTAWKAGLAALVASLTEAVLTGGNDNVVVPVVLWLCVKGLRI